MRAGLARLLVGVLLFPATALAVPRDRLDRDLAAYAQASCLAQQEQPYLREQGERWAGAVIERGAGPIEVWASVGAAVRRELATSGIGQGKPETPTSPPVPLPVLTCGEIADTAAVAAAVARARQALARYYRQP